MKRFLSVCALLAISSFAQAQKVMPKLSPVTKLYLQDAKKSVGNAPAQSYLYKKRNDGTVCIGAIVQVDKSSEAVLDAAFKTLDVRVGTKAGNIWTLTIPLDKMEAVCKTEGIVYVQMDEPVVPMLDVARITTRIDSVHAGINLPKGFSGKGVIVGVMDFGFDYNHPTFYDTSGKRYRILRSWEMGGTGTPPSGYTYGREITDTNALKLALTDDNAQTHGSGVAGLAAGSGYGTDGRFRGGAYESDMIFVGVRRDQIGGQWLTGGFSDFIDGVHYMFDQATALGRPIVVNVSWGSHSGPHDGSSLVNQAFDAMSGPGKIVVMSAGNEGGTQLHLDKTFSPTDTTVSTFLKFSSDDYKRTWIDIWGDTAETFCVETALYSKGLKGNTTGRLCIDNTTKTQYLISANGLDTCFVQTITSASEYNLKPRVTINIFNKAKDSVCITATGTNNRIDMWNEYYYYGFTYRYNCVFSSLFFPWAVSGNTQTTISDMGAGKSTLLVGAYCSKNKFTNLAGIPLSYAGAVGQYAGFTSRGPYLDGRVRPDITAPGLTIATSVNSQDPDMIPGGASEPTLVSQFTVPSTGKTYYYGEFQGTSASAPMASGIVALLLQIDPSLTPDRLRNLLAETAITDFFTGTLPAAGSNIWGHGKINAYGAARKLSKDVSVQSFKGTRKLDCALMPNPASGNFSLDLQHDRAEQLNVSITDISGKVVLQQRWKVQSGSNLLPLDMSNAPKGIYFVAVSGGDADVRMRLVLQ